MNDLVEAILDRAKEWDKATKTWRNKFKNFESMYRGDTVGPKRKQFGWADTASMEFFRCVESVASAEHAIIFTDDPWFTVVGTSLTPEDDSKARVTQAILEKQLKNNGFSRDALTAIRECAIYGTAVAEVCWEYKERWVQAAVLDPATGMPTTGLNKVTWVDQPKFKPVPLWRFMFDPSGTSIDDCDWVIEETDMDRNQLLTLIEAAKKQAGQGAQFQDISVLGDPDNKAKETEGSKESDEVRRNRGYQEDGQRAYRVKKYWGTHPTEKTAVPAIYYIVVVNDTDWIIQMVNPYPHGLKPYVSAQFIQMEESFYGWGLGHLLERTNIEITERQNLMQDQLTLALYPILTSDGASGLGLEKIKIFPGMYMSPQKYGQNIRAVKTYDTNTLQPAAGINENRKEEMRAVSGATSTVQAITTGDTATEVRTVAAEAARRLATVAEQFVDSMVRPFLYMSHENNREFMDKAMVVAISGENDEITRLSATKEHLVPDPEIEFHLALDLDNRPRMLRNLNQFMNVIGASMQYLPELRDLVKPLVMRGALLLGMKVRNFPPPSPMTQLIQQKEAERAAMGQVPVGEPPAEPEIPPTGASNVPPVGPPVV